MKHIYTYMFALFSKLFNPAKLFSINITETHKHYCTNIMFVVLCLSYCEVIACPVSNASHITVGSPLMAW